MVRHRLSDIDGKLIGWIELTDNTLPRAIEDGEEFVLAGSYIQGERDSFIAFCVIPVPYNQTIRKQHGT